MRYIFLSLLLLISGCSQLALEVAKEEPVFVKPRENLTSKLPILDGDTIPISVYEFTDKTGQRKPSDKLAQLSTAVPQGAESFVIKALQDSRNWFKVVERVGLDSLVKERQLIRNQREVYDKADAKQLPPLLVSGLIVTGSISGYDSDIRTGGVGLRLFKLGFSDEYRVDKITISMRVISVATGEVLVSVTTTKTIYSFTSDAGAMMFVGTGNVNALEAEVGDSVNEPITEGVRVAIEDSVYSMILEGEKKGLWKFKREPQQLRY
mgnify:CR=1 FL=1